MKNGSKVYFGEVKMSEWDKMTNGLEYNSRDSYILEMRKNGSFLMNEINNCNPNDINKIQNIIKKSFGQVGNNFWLNPPIHFTYGKNIIIGDDVFINLNCTFLDSGIIKIGNETLIGPDVKIYTSCHHVDGKRHFIDENGNKQIVNFTKNIAIGNNVWIGGGSIILGGVTIGDNSVIGAGSIVNKDIPSNVLAVGSPAKVIKTFINN